MKHYYQAAILFFLIVSTSTTADSTFDLSEFHGNVVLLDFWASWCVPCRRSFPWMSAMQEKYADDGLVIIAANVDSDPAAASAFLEEYPAQFRIINDPDADLAREYGVVAMPSSYIFDRGGELITRHLGFKVKKQDEYEAILVAALNTDEETQ
jgi:thiol-disulfide isomerase/thioredoxin